VLRDLPQHVIDAPELQSLVTGHRSSCGCSRRGSAVELLQALVRLALTIGHRL
jgi:hypothetical protein